MDVITPSFNLRLPCTYGGFYRSPPSSTRFSFRPYPFLCMSKRSFIYSVRKKHSESEPVLKPSIVKEAAVDVNEEEDIFLDDLEDDAVSGYQVRNQLSIVVVKQVPELDGDDDVFPEDEYLEVEPVVGDGSGGGGVSLAGTSWDKTVHRIAEEVVQSFDGDLGIYAFKTLLNGIIQVRIEKLTNKSGAPSLMDIEAFSSVYTKRLDEAEVAGSIPGNLSVEVSSPGVERVVRVPQDLGRFKDRPLFVKYIISKVPESHSESEHDGVLRLGSLDLETGSCIWGLADVRVNREKAGKGRPLSQKQRAWRLETTFDSLRLVRLYSDI